jgi:hypothetical protein
VDLLEELAEADNVWFGRGGVPVLVGRKEECPRVTELEQLLPLLLPAALPPLLLLLPAPLVAREEVRLGDAAEAAHPCHRSRLHGTKVHHPRTDKV